MSVNSLRVFRLALAIFLLLNLGACFELQRAVGCNRVGLFGCRDRAPAVVIPETLPSPQECSGRDDREMNND